MRHNSREKLSSGCIKKCRTEAEVEEATGRETTTTIETIIINAIRVVIDHHHHHGCVLFVVCDFYVLLSLLLSVVFQRERERERDRIPLRIAFRVSSFSLLLFVSPRSLGALTRATNAFSVSRTIPK